MTPTPAYQAEQMLLSCLLQNPSQLAATAGFTPAYFDDPLHRLIFSAICEMDEKKDHIDVPGVLFHCRAKGHTLDATYLSELHTASASPKAIDRWAAAVRQAHSRRQLILACRDALAAAEDPETGTPEAIDAVQSALSKAHASQTVKGAVHLGHFLASERTAFYEALHDGTAPAAWPTGLHLLDEKLSGGLRPGCLYILAARPGMGKSSLSQLVAMNFAKAGRTTLFLSQEMPIGQLADRAVSNIGRVGLQRLINGDLRSEEDATGHSDWGRILKAAKALKDAPLWVDDQGSLTLADIRAKARGMKGLKLLVLDYLQLCSGAGNKGENRNSEIEQISRGLKALAKELDIAVIALSQLNRQVESRPGAEPNAADLRDSGAIEQDADAILLLWPLASPPKPDAGQAKNIGIKVAKNRNGPQGRIAAEFFGAHQHWQEAADQARAFQPHGATSPKTGNGRRDDGEWV